MNVIEEEKIFNTKDLSIDYCILELRNLLNKDLYEKKIISFDVYNKMQLFLMKKMEDKKWIS